MRHSYCADATSAASCNDPALIVNSNSKHAPIATLRVAVRAQPLQDDAAAPFTLLCAGQGLLFAAPTHSGGLAVWAHAEGKITVRRRVPYGALLRGPSGNLYVGNLYVVQACAIWGGGSVRLYPQGLAVYDVFGARSEQFRSNRARQAIT